MVEVVNNNIDDSSRKMEVIGGLLFTNVMFRNINQ